MFIYKITNNINGKSYIGKTTKTAEERYKEHQYNHKQGQTHLYRAMRKHGIDNFSISVVEQTENLNEREKYWISTLSPEYNMTIGGDGGDTSSSPNYQNYMKNIRPYQISGEGNPFYGKKHNEKTIQKMKKAKIGKPLLEETKIKISKTIKEKGIKPPVRVFVPTKEYEILAPTGEIYKTQNLTQFCAAHNLDQRNMSKVMCGIYKSSKGYKMLSVKELT